MERFIFSDDPNTETARKRRELAERFGMTEADVVRNLILNAYEGISDTIRIPVLGQIGEGEK